MTYTNLWQRLAPIYGPGEAKAIVRLVLEEAFGLSLADIYCGKVTQLSADEQRLLHEMMARLERMEPVQYVLGRAQFMGRPFEVGPGVLIPRPETEELCDWAMGDLRRRAIAHPAILDVCTGSGCIAISMALGLGGATAEGWDISPRALDYARRNAEALAPGVAMRLQDALRPPCHERRWDAVVSNPPYILPRERAAMSRHVLDHEPAEALFVPEADPLVFHRAIAHYAAKALRPGGGIYLEINPDLADGVAHVLADAGFVNIQLRPDQYGKTRMAGANVMEK